MASYIQLLTLTPEGRARVLEDSTHLLNEQNKITIEGVRVLGQYAVLGTYDFVNIVEAPDNESVARFSIELGVRAGALITTLPAIPVAQLIEHPREELPAWETGISQRPPAE